jgi:ABC-type amino acid transport substrate-binding protein
MPRKFLFCAAALVMLAACIPAEPNDDLQRTFDPEDTVMGGIQQRGELIVGVESKVFPLVACLDDVGSDCPEGGFAVDLAKEVADSLGVDIRFVSGGTTELIGMPDAGEADLTFPFVPVTGDTVRPLHQTDPYFVAHERLLVKADSDIEQAADLTTEAVCQFGDAGTMVPIDEVNSFVTPIQGSYDECGAMFADGRVEVVVGPDLALAGLAQNADGKVVGDQLNTEGYSAFMEVGASAWVDYVNQVIEEAQQEGRWTEYYDRWIQPGLGESQDPPGMSLEEAAALYPEDA